MAVGFAVLFAAIVFGVSGFEIHALWLIADALLVAWMLGFIAPANERAVWYRW
jgi:hypothetical protein